jgi:hypothetical protein
MFIGIEEEAVRGRCMSRRERQCASSSSKTTISDDDTRTRRSLVAPHLLRGARGRGGQEAETRAGVGWGEAKEGADAEERERERRERRRTISGSFHLSSQSYTGRVNKHTSLPAHAQQHLTTRCNTIFLVTK